MRLIQRVSCFNQFVFTVYKIYITTQIYDLSTDKDVNVEEKMPEKCAKPVYLKDYERERLLKKGR